MLAADAPRQASAAHEKTIGYRYSSRAGTESTHSIPIPPRISDILSAKGLEVHDGIVRFAPHSKTHPRQWPLARKIYDIALICFLEFFMTLVSNCGSSISPYAAVEWGIGSQLAVFCFTTVYMIGQAIGGLVFPPIAESFGGRGIYLFSALGFAVFSLPIAIWPTLPIVVVGRLVTGFLSAMPCTVAAGSIENVWNMKSRTFVIHLWICSAVVGLACGPPLATFVSVTDVSWRWIFFLSVYVTGAVGFLCLGMRESRPSQVLRQQVKAISEQEDFHGLLLDEDNSLPSVRTFIKTSLILPSRLFFTEPIVWLTSIMAATVYGVVYLFAEALGVVYQNGFGFTDQQTSLVMLVIIIGVVLSFLPRFYDIHIALRRQRENRALEPEDKIFGFLVAAPVQAIGFWWFACTVPPLVTGISPWASIPSLVLVGFSVVEFDNVLSGYLCDTYATYAASANAPMSFLRAMLSGLFPLFGQQLFVELGPNTALFILAGGATLYCGIAVLFGVYGKRVRERSPMAEKVWSSGIDD